MLWSLEQLWLCARSTLQNPERENCARQKVDTKDLRSANPTALLTRCDTWQMTAFWNPVSLCIKKTE